MPLRTLERLFGIALTILGWHVTTTAWIEAGATARFSLPAAGGGPALAVVGLGVTFFRAERSALLDLLHLHAKWTALVLFALLLGALDVGHLLGW